MNDTQFTGYDVTREPRNLLTSAAINYDFEQFRCSGNIPETRGIKKLMAVANVREDQFRMNACAGFGTIHASAVCFWLATGIWRSFNPLWTYRHGQAIDGIRGDNGATIYGVTEGAKRDGLLPEDIENDGKKEFPFPRDQYDFAFPGQCQQLASERKVGYTVELKSYQAILNFLQAGQGAVVIGGPWGNWHPDSTGLCNFFAGGGGGHARAYVDWEPRAGQVTLVEANSHFLQYGDQGFAYHTPRFVDAQCADRNFVAIGISDITLSAGDIPKQRKHRFVKLV